MFFTITSNYRQLYFINWNNKFGKTTTLKKNKILLLFCIIALLPGCSILSDSAKYGSMSSAFYIKARKAENEGNLKTSLTNYKRSKSFFKPEKKGLIPTDILPEPYEKQLVELDYRRIIKSYERVYGHIGKYHFTGNIQDINSKVIAGINVTFKSKYSDKAYRTKTDINGSFKIKALGKGTLIINEHSGLFQYAVYKVDISPRSEKLFVGRNESYYYDEVIDLQLLYNNIIAEYERLDKLYEKKKFEKVIIEGEKYLQKYKKNKNNRSKDVRKLISKSDYKLYGHIDINIRKVYKAIMLLKNTKNYESIILLGRDYLTKYKGKENTNWQEVEKLVIQSLKKRAFENDVDMEELAEE